MAVCRVVNVLLLLDVYQSFLTFMQNATLLVVLSQNREIQEFVDDFVLKLRTVKFARTKAYDQLYSGINLHHNIYGRYGK